MAAILYRLLLCQLLALVMVCNTVGAFADEVESGFRNRRLGDHDYVVFVPQGEPPAAGWPVILFLHSAGERGSDGNRQVEYGIGPAVRNRSETFPAVVVFPQMGYVDGPILETWRAGEPGGQLARAILADVERELPINPSRRAITGWSMGAYGALSLAAADPAAFSRVLAISGGGETEWGPQLASLPVWMIHGDRDRIVPASESRAMADAILPHNPRSAYTEVPDAGHDLWRSVYNSDDVLDWLVSKPARKPPDEPTFPVEPASATESEDTAESFSPALVISRAIGLRFGNDALQTFADGIPRTLEDDGFHDLLEPVTDEVTFDGRSYDVRFEKLSYNGKLHRVIVAGRGQERLQMDVALTNLRVHIGVINVSDGTNGFTAGPVTVVIGHREPVWLELEVTPHPTPEGSLQLQPLSTKFEIGDQNWYVTPPNRIEIQGDLFQTDLVQTAIVGGIYRRKSVIEESVRRSVAGMLRQVEQRVDFAPLTRLVTTLWPLPVYKPRLQILLEDVAVDAHGVSLVFGCEVAAFESGGSPSDISHVKASVPPAADIEQSTGLQAAVAMDVMHYLSSLLAGTEAMALYTADVPGRPFQELDNASGVCHELDTINKAGAHLDVRSRLMLKSPFSYAPLPNAVVDATTVGMAIDVPRISLTIFCKDESSTEEWSVIAQRDLQVHQPLWLKTTTRLDGPTQLDVSWGESSVRSAGANEQSVAFVPDDPITRRFEDGWTRWADSQHITYDQLPDLTLGAARLRLDGFQWRGDSLKAMFRPAATVLTNRTNRQVRYCVRSEYSRWSEPLILRPGRMHVYRQGTPLQIRDAAQWSRNGQVLDFGTYERNSRPDDEGHLWTRLPDEVPAVNESATTAH